MHSKCVEAADIKTNLRSKKPDSIRKLASFSAFNFQYKDKSYHKDKIIVDFDDRMAVIKQELLPLEVMLIKF